jgi:hypothetical protein
MLKEKNELIEKLMKEKNKLLFEGAGIANTLSLATKLALAFRFYILGLVRFVVITFDNLL